MKSILTEVHTSNGDHYLAIIKLNESTANRWHNLTFQLEEQLGSQFYSLEVWFRDARYYKYSAELADVLSRARAAYVVVDDDFYNRPPDLAATCVTAIATQDGVYWVAYLAGTALRLETAEVPWEILLDQEDET